MGLDMYVEEVSIRVVVDDVTIDPDEYHSSKEIWYWRKHHALHKWFRQLYFDKGGSRESEFNGDRVRIRLKDLDALEKYIDLEIDDFHRNNEQDLKFIKTARTLLKDKKVLYYNSSW